MPTHVSTMTHDALFMRMHDQGESKLVLDDEEWAALQKKVDAGVAARREAKTTHPQAGSCVPALMLGLDAA